MPSSSASDYFYLTSKSISIFLTTFQIVSTVQRCILTEIHKPTANERYLKLEEILVSCTPLCRIC